MHLPSSIGCALLPLQTTVLVPPTDAIEAGFPPLLRPKTSAIAACLNEEAALGLAPEQLRVAKLHCCKAAIHPHSFDPMAAHQVAHDLGCGGIAHAIGLLALFCILRGERLLGRDFVRHLPHQLQHREAQCSGHRRGELMQWSHNPLTIIGRVFP